jgi:hypothetical protein
MHFSIDEMLHCVLSMAVQVQDVFGDMNKKCKNDRDATCLRIMKLTLPVEFVLSPEKPFLY